MEDENKTTASIKQNTRWKLKKIQADERIDSVGEVIEMLVEKYISEEGFK